MEKENENKKPGMSSIVKIIASWQRVFIFMFGIYLITYGHIIEGGGFAGGVVIAGTFILITLAFGKDTALSKLGRLLAFKLSSLGGLLLIFLALTGVPSGNNFMTNVIEKNHPSGNFELFSGGLTPLYNIGLGLILGASFFMIFIILSMHRVITVNGAKKLVTTGNRRKK
jgi:multicomponent Na+:H+ antiporter subunit B